jgi:hypothetical protein
MSDIRKYRGYIVTNHQKASKNIPDNGIDKWIIKFPDFPEIEIFGNDEMLMDLPLNPKDREFISLCYREVIDSVIEIIDDGRDVPKPQLPLDYKPFIDVEVDVELLIQGLCFKLTN